MAQKQHKQQPQSKLQGQKKINNDLQMQKHLILRKRIFDKQLSNIKQMTYHQLLDKSRNKQPITPPSPRQDYIVSQKAKQLMKAGVPQNEAQELAYKEIQTMKQIRKNNAIIRRQMRQTPIWSQIKRGKLGFDSILILFGIFGSVTLPFIFYQKFKKNKQIIISSRGVDPKVIENLTQDSPIDIDSISQQSIHYDNPERRARFNQMMERVKKITELKRELDL